MKLNNEIIKTKTTPHHPVTSSPLHPFTLSPFHPFTPSRVLLAIVYLTMWAGGIFHYVVFGKPPLDAPWAASLFLLLAGVIVVWTSARRDWLTLGLAAALGFAAEIHGVKYGLIFSPYEYTKVLVPHLAGVPVVMFSAWLVLLASTRQLFAGFALPAWLEITLCAAWMTAIDLVIDPLAANQLGYWRWSAAGSYYGIPLHNFIGWFSVSAFIYTVVRQRWQTNHWAQAVGLSITFFFSAIALSFGLWLAGFIGLGLCVIHAMCWRRQLRNAQSPDSP
jgi:bisanhydrobacterioruberin hydratase